MRGTNGGFFRYNPARRHLQRTARLSIPNPWGIAFDHWGQDFFADTSDPNARWMLQGSVRVGFGNFAPQPPNLLGVRVRPTSGLEFISSRHFPDEVQGDLLINNVIGFLGTKQHGLSDEGTGFKTQFRHDLMRSKDPNFRPVDMEIAPDGSLYFVDWHNARIGHMQHNARDPNRDHSHGRIYRISHATRPLVKPAKIHGADIPTLLANLKLPEYRSRYRTRRELRGRDPQAVATAVKSWAAKLNKSDPNYEHHIAEAVWVTWGVNRIDADLVRFLALKAKDFRARSVGVRAIRYNTHAIADHVDLLKKTAADAHGRVRLETIVAASWLDRANGLAVLDAVKEDSKNDKWSSKVYSTARAYLQGQAIATEAAPTYATTLTGESKKSFLRGAEVFGRDGHCGTCHQADGKGLPAAMFPPLVKSEWVSGNKDRLIKIALHGVVGPMTVNGKKYPGLVPMTPFKHLSDKELADVLTFVRNTFENKASVVTPADIAKVRAATKTQTTPFQAADLLKAHPN